MWEMHNGCDSSDMHDCSFARISDNIFGYTSDFLVQIGKEGLVCTIQVKNSFAICSIIFTE